MIISFLIINALLFGDFQKKCHGYTYFFTNLFLLCLITECLFGSIWYVNLFLPGDLAKVINRLVTLPAQLLLKQCLNVLSFEIYKIFTVFIIHVVTTRIYFYLISVSSFPITLLEYKSLYFLKENNMTFERQRSTVVSQPLQAVLPRSVDTTIWGHKVILMKFVC